jgi:hypothetical protein
MGSITVRLKKSLYGCKQSGLNWYNHIKTTLTSIGYLSNIYDPCVFVQVMDDSSSTILLYVDDLMIFADTEASLMLTIDHLRKILIGTSSEAEDMSLRGWSV